MKETLCDELNALADSWPRERVANDPLGLIGRYRRRADIEVAALAASALAYGQVDQIIKNVGVLLDRMGPSPEQTALQLGRKPDRNFFKGFNYRFTGPEDIGGLVTAVGRALSKYGSLESLFLENYSRSRPIKGALAHFVAALRRLAPSWGGARGAKHLLPSPEGSSACKRLNLYLRWMVRREKPDLGLWRKVAQSDLVIPVDLHILRISRCIGLTRLKTATWKTAEQITRALALFCPRDPVRYDFALAHLGMMHPCRKDACPQCRLVRFKIK